MMEAAVLGRPITKIDIDLILGKQNLVDMELITTPPRDTADNRLDGYSSDEDLTAVIGQDEENEETLASMAQTIAEVVAEIIPNDDEETIDDNTSFSLGIRQTPTFKKNY